MKTLLKFAAVLILFLGFTSCDELDELTEIDFNTTLNESVFVSVPAGEDLVLNETMLININNSDTQDYLDVLQDVSITSFTYRLINFTGDANGTISGQFEADGVALVNHDMVIKDEVDAGTVFEVTDPSALNAIANSLKSGNNVSVGITGTSTCEEAMNFSIAVTIELAITADVL
ncbi:hypothetical protein J4050_03520 [Winogradskyella sp. DF17]|uniref:DUF1735 domain-containing protein n=1 Tax=Winogradskyella pelagia TaxID=2819984 RepID=A0ABS3SZ77_9FLAO|nr:hypothetical protein [Winogradskyella sp. DF17]MBO3115798.1 hypothetical protein [Winogradskyella sp. DF17]